jgi:hypothetical protein
MPLSTAVEASHPEIKIDQGEGVGQICEQSLRRTQGDQMSL